MKFKKHEISKITGVSARRILDWTQKKYLIPAEYVEGQGRTSFYSPADAVWVKILDDLSKIGFSIAKFIQTFEESDAEYGIEDIIGQLNPFDQTKKPKLLIIFNNFEKVILGEYKDIKGKYRTLTIINLFELKKEVRELLA